MSTWLQLLRIAFWQRPLQRVLVVAGLSFLLVGPFLPVALSPPGSRLPQTFFGATLVLITPMVCGGIWWRMLSAPRIVRLAPHGRLKLLFAAAGIAVAGSLLWLACYAYAFQVQVPLQNRPTLGDYLVMFTLTLVFATHVSIGQFIASHSPAGLLAALALWVLPGLLLRAAGIEQPAAYWQRPEGWVALAVTWVVFGVWYVRARRIASPGWLKAGDQSLFVMQAGLRAGPVSPRRGFEGLLLGGSSVPGLALQWLLATCVLLGVQGLIAHYAASDPVPAVAMLFTTLSISTVVAGAVANAIAQRSHTLWLPAGLDRAALFRRCEGLALRVCAALAIVCGLLFALLWATLAAHPPWRWQYVLASLLVPALAVVWLGLAQVKRSAWVDVPLGAAIVAAWYAGTVVPLFSASGQERWGLLLALAVGAAGLRELARRRWQRVEWRS